MRPTYLYTIVQFEAKNAVVGSDPSWKNHLQRSLRIVYLAELPLMELVGVVSFGQLIMSLASNHARKARSYPNIRVCGSFRARNERASERIVERPRRGPLPSAMLKYDDSLPCAGEGLQLGQPILHSWPYT